MFSSRFQCFSSIIYNLHEWRDQKMATYVTVQYNYKYKFKSRLFTFRRRLGYRGKIRARTATLSTQPTTTQLMTEIKFNIVKTKIMAFHGKDPIWNKKWICKKVTGPRTDQSRTSEIFKWTERRERQTDRQRNEDIKNLYVHSYLH
jgi:hypothetical protein